LSINRPKEERPRALKRKSEKNKSANSKRSADSLTKAPRDVRNSGSAAGKERKSREQRVSRKGSLQKEGSGSELAAKTGPKGCMRKIKSRRRKAARQR